jgi:hypothetical protein
MAGWIAMSGSAAGQVFDELYGVTGDVLVRAQGVARPDVAAYFKAPAMTQCGFELSIARYRLQLGVQPVYLVGCSRKKTSCTSAAQYGSRFVKGDIFIYTTH